MPYKSFEYLKHWRKEDDLKKLKSIIRDNNKLFSFALSKTEELYSHLPLRKNGQENLVHPLNTILALKDANITNEVTLCVGILHDFIEEKVDLYRDEHKIKEDKKGIKILDDYELEVFDLFEKELTEFCKEKAVDEDKAKKIIESLKLLTRHKRDFYYRSISNIFEHQDEEIKEIAIQVKLADRMHNVQCIECFNEQARIFECFKNLFILNNTKKYLLEDLEKRISNTREIPPTQLLFKRCAKSTYDASQTICNTCFIKGISNVQSMLQLAFKKFAFEKAGVWEVTTVDEKETHLMRLSQGIVRKYDARLHHEWNKFDSMKEAEYNYCQKFFADYNFTDEQIKTILDYKDAYALKEVITYLIYLPDYVLSRFLSSELTSKARISN